ncbi:MAG: G5 domain-containing protein [Clostridium sp.]|uniref:G5 and 3D domain-containing protein n=1 Tax=Clostridium TaxID=1485 RepID=UPI002152F31E|nr:G5 and 3D domain-containing protein [Clostridium sp. LY3-2]MCR6514994.1 G5 domain-containing protein [Clostridium sp. LY3-2]
MVEKLKAFYEKNFSNSPKAKYSVIAIACVIVVALAITSMRKTVTVSIDGKEEAFVTYKGTVKEALQDKGIQLSEKDKVQPSLEAGVKENQLIAVKRAVPISVEFAGKKVKLLSAEETVGDALLAESETLKQNGVDYNKELDEVSPKVDEPVAKDMDIKVVDVEVKNLKEKQSIPFETVTKKDSGLERGKTETKTEGKNGQKEVTYELVYKDGKVASKKEVSSKVVAKPVNAIVSHGTKKPSVYIPNRGSNVEFKKHLVMESTAYSGDGITATGSVPVYNPGGISTIAVDPSVIPLGSLVYVEGYGYAKAADTGGVIKGNIIDVFLSSSAACSSWGRKYGVDVYIISYPGEW